MLRQKFIPLSLVIAAMLGMLHGTVDAKPLKVYILAGQSNMQGTARVRTIQRLKLSKESLPLYEDMQVKNGLPSAVKDTYGVYFTGGDKKRGKDRALNTKKGPLQPGFGEEMTENTSFGPEYTFAITMQKHLNEPILIIKTAWGGRNLLHQFRPPSAGPLDTDTGGHGNPIGYYYQTMIKLTKEVLADPSKYHPAYNKDEGYEIAGFVWFQGFNDMVGPYPKGSGGKDYTEYGRLLACFIRDVRKDLNAPQMPFVIGVMGIGGPMESGGQVNFRKAQAMPAAMPEFQGNVAAVHTENYWDMDLKRIEKKLKDAITKKLKAENPKLGGRSLSKAIGKKKKTMAPQILTPEELKITKVGTSNQAYHYMGSAYIYGRIGEAFAEAMIKMK